MSDNTITHSKHSHSQKIQSITTSISLRIESIICEIPVFDPHWLKSDLLISLKADSTHIACNDFNTKRNKRNRNSLRRIIQLHIFEQVFTDR